ncbi:MAG: glycosyltransferase family 1 protein [Chloroflexota bacterium]
MIVGIDASRATAAHLTGTEGYAYHLIHALINHAGRFGESRYRLRLYFNRFPTPGAFPDLPFVEPVIIPFPRLWTHLRLAWELHRRPPDVFFTPAHVIPYTYRGRSVATIHDLGYHYFPEAHTRGQVSYLRWSTAHNGRRARLIIADSQATKEDLTRLYTLDPGKIKVIYPGLAPGLRPVTDRAELAAVQQKYDIHPPYLLYLGTLQPRKNLVRLVEAYAQLPAPRPQLVLAGKVGWLAQPILTAVASNQSSITNNQLPILLPGYVAEEDKAALISGAIGLLFPSLYEGFGFPVLEGQVCGVPVLAANTSSLPEIAGEGALLVDPLDTAGLSAAIHRLIHDEALRQRLIQAGFANAQQFTWQRAAEQVLALLEEVASGR